MKLSIIIPAFNEENTIEKVIGQVALADTPGFEKEIIVVNDGSRDKTGEILNKIRDKFNFILFDKIKNQGKGSAIKDGIKISSGDYIIIQDADLEYSPSDYKKLINSIDSEHKAIFGSRNMQKRDKGYLSYYFGGKMLTSFFNIFFKTKLTDVMTCYKLFPSHIIKNNPTKSAGFDFEIEITAKIIKSGIKIKEIPIQYYPRKISQGKKIKFRDGVIGVWAIIRNRFS